jgi:hypothetical protein
MTMHQSLAQPADRRAAIHIVPLALSLSAFFAITYLLCLGLGLFVPDAGMHKPWLQFLPGFEWLTLRGFLIGLVWTQLYGWYIASLFGLLFNFFATRNR